jgi:hypothetical protein
VKLVHALDPIHIPPELAICSACGSQLFASVQSYFVDDGRPVKSEIYVGCVECEDKIDRVIVHRVREWIYTSYRVMRS